MGEDHYAEFRQEAFNDCIAALRAAGLNIDREQLRIASKNGQGEYSDIALLRATARLFEALNNPKPLQWYQQ